MASVSGTRQAPAGGEAAMQGLPQPCGGPAAAFSLQRRGREVHSPAVWALLRVKTGPARGAKGRRGGVAKGWVKEARAATQAGSCIGAAGWHAWRFQSQRTWSRARASGGPLRRAAQEGRPRRNADSNHVETLCCRPARAAALSSAATTHVHALPPECARGLMRRAHVAAHVLLLAQHVSIILLPLADR
jgi:hypothetical protein